jgi:hypothetical protein
VKDERQIFETLSVWLKKQEPPLTQEAQIEMFSLVRFPLLPLDLLQSSGVAENTALSTLAGRTMLLAQLPNAYLAMFPEAVFTGSARTNLQVISRAPRLLASSARVASSVAATLTARGVPAASTVNLRTRFCFRWYRHAV